MEMMEKKAHFAILINHHFICYGEKLRRLMNAQNDSKQTIFFFVRSLYIPKHNDNACEHSNDGDKSL